MSYQMSVMYTEPEIEHGICQMYSSNNEMLVFVILHHI